jgi:hypothetical protein
MCAFRQSPWPGRRTAGIRATRQLTLPFEVRRSLVLEILVVNSSAKSARMSAESLTSPWCPASYAVYVGTGTRSSQLLHHRPGLATQKL